MKIITDRKILHQISKKTTLEEIEKLDLRKKLIKANEKAWTHSLGLAAIQIGIPLRYSVFLYNGFWQELINPHFGFGVGKGMIKEGCLSIPNKWFMVERFYEIEYTVNGKRRKAKGLKAQIIQHEIDHLNGILIDELKKEE